MFILCFCWLIWFVVGYYNLLVVGLMFGFFVCLMLIVLLLVCVSSCLRLVWRLGCWLFNSVVCFSFFVCFYIYLVVVGLFVCLFIVFVVSCDFGGVVLVSFCWFICLIIGSLINYVSEFALIDVGWCVIFVVFVWFGGFGGFVSWYYWCRLFVYCWLLIIDCGMMFCVMCAIVYFVCVLLIVLSAFRFLLSG